MIALFFFSLSATADYTYPSSFDHAPSGSYTQTSSGSSRNRPTTGAPASTENKPGGSSSTAASGGASASTNRPSGTPSGNLYVPTGTLKISNAHSVETIRPNTRWGGGDRNTPKTIALRGVDLKVDLQAIQAGQGVRLANGNVQAPSGRVYGIHPDRNSVYPISGPGLVQLTQAEFSIYKQLLQSNGLQGNALKAFQGQIQSGNQGLSNSSQQRLEQLFNSRGN